MGSRFRITDEFLKFDSLNKTKQRLSVNKAKSTHLTLLNQDSSHIFTTNYILFQKRAKVEVSEVFNYTLRSLSANFLVVVKL